MTSYTAIADTEIDAESPVTEELITRLRDNPIAIGEGATGAPRIWGSAIARPQDMPTLTVTAADTVNCEANCDVTDGTYTTNNTDDPHSVIAQTWELQSVTGTVRIKATLASANNANTVRASAWKNGVQQGANQSSTSSAGSTVSFDVSAVPGDILQLRHSSTNIINDSELTNVRLLASDGYVQRVPYVAKSALNTP